MSSILDALKKVEAEKEQKKVDLGEVEEMLAERDLLAPEEKEPRRRVVGARKAGIVVALVGGLVVFGAVGFVLYGPLTGTRRARVTEESQASTPIPARVPQPAFPAPLEPAPGAPTPVSEPRATAPEVSEPESAVPESAASPGALATATVPTPVEGEAAAAPPVQEDTPKRPALKINILRPPSEEFPEPLAVVNGKKAGIGDEIDGAKVIEIRSDGIVFEYGDDLFLVEF